MRRQNYSITEFGAQASESVDNTKAIQAAIDAAHRHGGGRVVVPPGVFVSGTLWLRDHVALEIGDGAVLRAVGEIAAYPAHHLVDPESRKPFVNPDLQPHSFLIAHGVRHGSICGRGTIQLAGEAFWNMDNAGPRTWIPARIPRVSPSICLHRCEDFRIHDVTIRNSSGWTIEANSCERLWIRGIYIRNNFWGPNTDGIDIQGCRDVFISDCRVDCSDDAICLKTLPDTPPNERITVTNCICRTQCVGLKLGCHESFQAMRQIVFSNCVVHECSRGIGVYSTAGADIEDVLFENIVIETNPDWGFARPIHIDLRRFKPEYDMGSVRNVRCNNIHCKTNGRILLTASPGARLDRISLTNIHMDYSLQGIHDPLPGGRTAGSTQFSNDNPEAREARGVVVAENIDNLLVRDCSVAWPAGGSAWPVPFVWGKSLAGGVADNPMASASGGAEKYQMQASSLLVRREEL